MAGREAEIAVFGGTGMYDPEGLEGAESFAPETPYGPTSGEVTLGRMGGRRVAFMPRHGRGHTIAPHAVNYRANVWAMRELGATRVLAPSAVGSLREGIRPGDVAVPDQFVDFTRGREGSFSGGGRVVHISVADPFCPEMRAAAAGAAREAGARVHDGCTYVCINGPRFSTRAESEFYRRATDGGVIGMTAVPECQLAREARMCYATVASVTDYDVWAERPVSAREVRETLRANAERARAVLAGAVRAAPPERRCGCAAALDEAGI